MQRLIVTPSQFHSGSIQLTAEQQHYLRRVLRLQAGDRFLALDGQGQQWVATLTETAAVARVMEMPVTLPLTADIILAAALPKGSGFDEVVRQATELGATKIWPIVSDRTLLRPSPQKLTRWQRITAEATEQSERPTVPDVCEPRSFDQLLQMSDTGRANYLCSARHAAPHLLSYLLESDASVLIATGPEGGWTEMEVEKAIAAGYQVVSLGRLILRAVTAPLAALTLVNAAQSLRAAAAQNS
ncbi:MAG: 16S rRNA (uracil(1498)-N(3))-methyltransferase [Leptolyngbyaceae cyanobacterium SL_1_1]|nr:16S rRNA (uracil(1498)-N(3))-methyltransferase [Leptolyngbyaceae cyanobacterium RM1_1_2]NJO09553.1 16S rRNA (uracil(1498)-N(3))-methyltransferase [Leptolyngbyaceae cyanobacterium SL_1_1]